MSAIHLPTKVSSTFDSVCAYKSEEEGPKNCFPVEKVLTIVSFCNASNASNESKPSQASNTLSWAKLPRYEMALR